MFFVHLRRMKSDGNGGKVQDSKWAATVAIEDSNCPGKVRCGVSLCSPLDQFSRKRGRMIASGRVHNSPYLYLGDCETVDDYIKAAKNIVKIFVCDEIHDSSTMDEIFADLELGEGRVA